MPPRECIPARHRLPPAGFVVAVSISTICRLSCRSCSRRRRLQPCYRPPRGQTAPRACSQMPCPPSRASSRSCGSRSATSRSASRFARTAVAVIARARCRYGQPALKPVDTTSKRRRKARGVVANDARGQPRQPRQPRKSKGRRWRRLGPQDRRRRPRRRQTHPPGNRNCN